MVKKQWNITISSEILYMYYATILVVGAMYNIYVQCTTILQLVAIYNI